MARLFINKQTRKLSSDRQGRNPLSFDSLIPTAGAEMEIELFAVEATGPGTLTSPTITIASKDAPRGGTLSLSYDGTSLGEISVRAGAAEWEAYVNANTSISALGGMVVQIDDGRVLLVSRAAGVFADFAVVSSDLLPFGTAVLTQIQAGDANEREIWVLRTELGTIAVQNVFSQSSTVSATVTELISGGASAAEVQRIAISGEPVMGFWTITTASGMTLPLRWDVGPRHVEAAMNAKLGDGTVSVSQAAAFTFDVAWNAVGTQSPLTVGTGGLTGIQCSSATFTLDTAEADAIPDWADAWVQITDSSEVIYSEQVTLRNLNLVGDQPVTQTAGVVRYDAAQTLTSGQQEQARTNISAAKSGAVTGSGLTMAGQRLLGRATGGVGALDEIQLGTGLALSGDLSVLSSYGGQGAADGDMMVQFSADGSITATAGVHLTGDSGYVALYNEGALGVLFNPIDVNSHFGLLERKIALDQDTVWTLPNLSGTVMVGASNLSDVASVATARTNLGLTSLSTTTPGAGIATWLSTPSSANLAAALTDKTGTGAAVFASSPTLVTPILGTPTSGTLTNCTIPASGISTGIIPDDRLYPLRPTSFAGPYDDDFTGADLDPKWTRHGLVAGDHTYQTGNGSWMSMDIPAGTVGGTVSRNISQSWYPTDGTIECRIAYQQIGSFYPMMGPFFADASGNGIGLTFYNNSQSVALCNLTSWRFSNFNLIISMGAIHVFNVMSTAGGIWYKLRKYGTTYYGSVSLDGIFWGPEFSGTNTTAMAAAGMGLFHRGTVSSDYGSKMHFDYFRIT